MGGSKKYFKYVKDDFFAAEPRLKRDEDRDDIFINDVVCVSEGLIGSAAHIDLS